MFLHQAIEQRFLRGSPHLLELERLQFAQAIFDGCLVDQHPFACRHCQASHIRVDSLRRLSFGYRSISVRIYRVSC